MGNQNINFKNPTSSGVGVCQELAEKIIRHTIDSVNIQTVFTSHNTGLVDNSIMRPDCYLLLTNGKLKSLVDLTSRELREAHNLEKMLRNGEFKR